MLRELSEFLRIPSVSTLPAHDADVRRAAEWVANELRRLGCGAVKFLGSVHHPVVWGVGPEVPGAPTLLVYGHYDVQPPDPLAEWVTPPFDPTVRDGRIYARGAVDDKGQVFCLLKAIEASGAPPVNFRFLIEGEEEVGSANLDYLSFFGNHEANLVATEPAFVADDDRMATRGGASRERQRFVLAAAVECQNRDEGWFHHASNDSDARAEESFRRSGSFLVEFFRMPEGAARSYRFGPFLLDVGDRSLKREGAPIPLTPKTFDLLVMPGEEHGGGRRGPSAAARAAPGPRTGWPPRCRPDRSRPS